MGIRFLCPNGHKLNVKSFLAGKRGICPECDAKFLVPHESGVQVEAATADSESAVSSDDPLDHGYADKVAVSASSTFEVPMPPPMPVDASPSTEVAGQEPVEVWYVRSAAGEQFGPATTEMMRGWVTEGRVPVDSWVWRTGWPEWKTGGQAITFLNGPPAKPVSAAIAPVADMPEATPQPEVPVDTVAGPLPEAVAPTVVHRTSRRSRQERARKVTFFLGGVVLLLFAVLVAVLIQHNR